jgi:Flp pilus assembly protein TadG
MAFGTALSKLKTSATGFRKDEGGSLIIFSLYIFVIMIMVGGTAVELMRFEAERKHLQNTIDSAVLTASDLKQREDSEAVVRSFFKSRGATQTL